MLTENPPELGDTIVEEILDDLVAGRRVSSEDSERVADAICAAPNGKDWERRVELDLKDKKWCPPAVSKDRKRLLYVYLQDELPRYVRERLELASSQGIAVVVALPIASLYKLDVVSLLVDLEAEVLVVDDYTVEHRSVSRTVLSALAEIGVPLSPEDRQTICRTVWSRIADGTAQERGRRLEALLAFLFSQVRDLKVIERNYRTETEEIDLVLQVDNFSRRSWQRSGMPFILVEAKNRIEKASQQVVSVLLAKLLGKRGTTRIAFLVSLAGFTDDARMQELRFAAQELCVVMIGRAEMEKLIEAEDLDGALETLVSHALLR